jgi:Zn-dependent peptidase ImmA (M78 family)
MSVDKARGDATSLIEQFKIVAAPVPVERIARNLGIKIQYVPFDGELSGMAFIKDGVSIIGVNSLHHPNRQRFTLAHELAHIRLHHEQIRSHVHVDKGSLRRDAKAAAGVDPTEIEANAFASEILMPQRLLAIALAGKTVDLEDDELITALARRFKVSETAMRFRLQ